MAHNVSYVTVLVSYFRILLKAKSGLWLDYGLWSELYDIIQPRIVVQNAKIQVYNLRLIYLSNPCA